MALTGYVSKTTGLPTVSASSPGPIYAGSRLLAVMDAAGVVSDALAAPGVSTVYRQGSGKVTLARKTTSNRYVNVTGLDGRGFTRAWFKDDGDKTSWSSPATILETGAARWPLRDNLRTGSGKFILWDEGDRDGMWALLRSAQPIIISPGAPTLGVPAIRAIVVSKVAAQRFGPEGTIQYDVDWTEVPMDSPLLRGADGGYGACPAVTWGEWDNYEHHWAARTYTELCTLIGGRAA